MNDRWRRLFRNPFSPEAERRALDDEMAFHLASIERRLVAAGMSTEQARAEARRRFGDSDRWRSAALAASDRRERSTWRRNVWDAMSGEVVAAIRRLSRRPSHTIPALVVMTVGIASGTAIWGVLDPVLFRPLPFPESHRVVAITGSNARSVNWWLSEYTYEQFRGGQRSFSAMAATRNLSVTLLDPFPDDVGALRVESSFFDVLGVPPAMGRAFAPDEDASAADQVVILTHDLWRDRFGADPDILGTTVRLREGTAAVVGILPEGFRWEADQFDEARPEGPERRMFLNRVFGEGPPVVTPSGSLMPVARLSEGVSTEAADRDLDRIALGLAQEHPEHFDDQGNGWGPFTAHVWSIRDRLLWLTKDEVWLLVPAVLILLLLVSLNAGSLLLVGVLDRQGELAVCAALGASRGRLATRVLLETGLLWVLALGSGLALAAVTLPIVRDLAPEQLPFAHSIGLHLRIVVGATVLAGVLWLGSGVAPLLSSLHPEFVSALQIGGWSETRPRARAQRALIVLQIALACALTGGAALLVRSYAGLLGVPPGATAQDVVAIEIRPPVALFNQPTVTVGALGGPWDPAYTWQTADDQLWGPGVRLQTFVEETLDRLRAVPGVRAATFTNMPPFQKSLLWRGVLRPDQTLDMPREELVWARVKWVSAGYFETVGVPILRGRPILPTDNDAGSPVMVVNEAFVERFLPEARDPLGRALPLGVSASLPPSHWTVVGVVPNVLHQGPHEPAEPTFYIPLSQLPRHWTRDQVGWTRQIWFLVEHEGDVASVLPGLREAVWSMAPDVPLRTEATLTQMKERLTIQTRFFTLLLGTFSAIALILATAGLMAMLAQRVRHRTREYGLRKALGAGVLDVLVHTLRHVASLAVAGTVLGTALAWLLARLLTDLITGVEGWSLGTQIAVAGLLLAAATAASLGPALHAARVDPVASLKVD